MRPRIQLRILAPAALGALLPSCSSEQASPPPGVILEIDGLRVTAEDIADFEDYFRELDPIMGRAYRTRELLDQTVLPLLLARRAFAEQRASEKRKAETLREMIGDGGYYELSGRGEPYGGFQPELPFGRNSLPRAVARYAFDDHHLFDVSPPIEVSQGFCLIATRRILRGTTTVEDQVEAYVVPFYTHAGQEFADWYEREKERVGHLVTYVHPDYREVLPPWVKVE